MDAIAFEEQTFRLIGEAGNYRRWIYRTVNPFLGHRVLEMGCGVGNMTGLFLDDRRPVVATDMNAQYLEVVGRRFGNRPGLETRVLDFAKVDVDSVRGLNIDTVFCCNVLEHIDDDVGALRRVNDILVPNGRIVLLAPALAWLYAEHDRLAGHFRRYGRAELQDKFAKSGFQIAESFYFNFPGIVGWVLNYQILHRKLYGSGHLSIFEKMVPAFSAVENVVRPPVGLSLIFVGRKPG